MASLVERTYRAAKTPLAASVDRSCLPVRASYRRRGRGAAGQVKVHRAIPAQADPRPAGEAPRGPSADLSEREPHRRTPRGDQDHATPACGSGSGSRPTGRPSAARRPTSSATAHSGDEQLWQREVGNTLPVLAMAYVLTGEKQLPRPPPATGRSPRAATRPGAWAGSTAWTWPPGTSFSGWRWSTTGATATWTRRPARQIRETLVKRTSAMFEAAATGKAWWQRSYLQNHLWVNISGMAVARAGPVRRSGRRRVLGRPAAGQVPPHHGRRSGRTGPATRASGYWEYGVEYMLKFMDLARTLLDVDLYGRPGGATRRPTDSVPHAAAQGVDARQLHRGHRRLPARALVRPGVPAARAGPAVSATATRNGWPARSTRPGVAASGATWLNLVWYDPTVPAKPPESLPTLRHFQDMGIVSARSDWSGDESLVVFKCGPFIGHEAMDQLHLRPRRRARPSGRQSLRPVRRRRVAGARRRLPPEMDRPAQHAAGQRPRANGRRVDVVPRRRAAGPEGEARDPVGGLHTRDRPLRRRCGSRISCRVGVEAVLAASAVREAEYPHRGRRNRDGQGRRPGIAVPSRARADPGRHGLRCPRQAGDATDRAVECRGARVTTEATVVPGEGSRKATNMPAVRIAAHRSKWRTAVAFSWSAAGSEPPRIAFQIDGNRWVFTARGQRIEIDWIRKPNANP